jgi:hypothetical protein
MSIEKRRCLEVKSSKDEEGAPVGVAKQVNEANQRWKVIYQEDQKKEADKGFNEEFGFSINRPFYFKSRMMFHRVIDQHSNSWNYLRRYVKNRTSQQWYFDQVSKTIKNKWRTNYSLQIHSNGGHKLVSATTTNSRWW